jgi:uncharacterized membrane protein YdjX (TVP38/TMEM64 family)
MERATYRQLLGMACLCAVALGAAALFSPATVVAELEHLATHPAQFALVLAAVYLVRPFLLWPVSSIALVLGYLYGPAVALPLALAGAALTGLPPFLVARYASDEGLLGFVGNSGRQLVDAVGETRGVLAARLSPVPGDPISYAAGLSDVSVGAFLLGTVVGEVPWALVTVFTGDSMRRLSVTGFSVSPAALVAMAGLAIIVLSGPLYSHYREASPEFTSRR